ncbi:uncharacterized protein OCT59_027055 [Rhizophagus irregularis]|uniref:uncharacterized protein n=1 Tax=Rhizophagus irregularis TaxID=588596 RepID=UPI00332FCBCD|nr:hypothetical protein OCT59_027055 [Rhizophagus irregularis]
MNSFIHLFILTNSFFFIFVPPADGGAAPPTNGKDPKEVLANEASGTAYWQMVKAQTTIIMKEIHQVQF